MEASLASLMHWDIAPENPARLANAGVKIAFTADGLKDIKDFLPRVRTAVERGLSREKALAALTTTPAKIAGATEQLGTVELGKLAYLVVADGDIVRWTDARVQERQPRPDERRIDEIGWAKDIRAARELSRKHGRPVFLFTMDGRIAIGRC